MLMKLLAKVCKYVIKKCESPVTCLGLKKKKKVVKIDHSSF